MEINKIANSHCEKTMFFAKTVNSWKRQKKQNFQKNVRFFCKIQKSLFFPKEIVTFSKQKTLGDFCPRRFSHSCNANNAEILVFPKENLHFLKNR